MIQYPQVSGSLGVCLPALSCREVEARPWSAILSHLDHVSAFSCVHWGCKCSIWVLRVMLSSTISTDLDVSSVRSLINVLVSLEMVVEFLVVSLKTTLAHGNTQAH